MSCTSNSVRLPKEIELLPLTCQGLALAGQALKWRRSPSSLKPALPVTGSSQGPSAGCSTLYTSWVSQNDIIESMGTGTDSRGSVARTLASEC
jgi:hypothetical protein